MNKELLNFMTWVNQDEKLGYTPIGIERIVNRYIKSKDQIIDEVYKGYLSHTILGVKNGFDRIKGYMDGCLVEFDGEYEHFSNPSFQYGYRPHTKEEFIIKCKTDNFGENWGFKIEEKELSLEERKRIYEIEYTNDIEVENNHWLESKLKTRNIPTKQITLEYNNEKTYYYE